jgi:hypothetical protein
VPTTLRSRRTITRRLRHWLNPHDAAFGVSADFLSQQHQERGPQGTYGTVTTEVHITAESSGSQTPPSTSAASIEPVLHRTPLATTHHPWGAPDDDNDDVEPISPTGGPVAKPFTTISSITSPKPRAETQTKQTNNNNILNQTWTKFTSKLHNLDPIKLAYLRTSFVFAISVLVTWTPSSINRVYSLIYPNKTSYALNLASAIVLPLQGVWNAIIFAATSWNLLREEFGDVMDRCPWWCCWWWLLPGGGGGGSRRHRRRQRRLSDGVRGGKQPGEFGEGCPGRVGSAPESRELPAIPRMANVRVIRGSF